MLPVLAGRHHFVTASPTAVRATTAIARLWRGAAKMSIVVALILGYMDVAPHQASLIVLVALILGN
jgi:hypothetical protein